MSDSIDRQAAIDAICNACGKIDCDKMDKCEKLQLPPANCSEFPNNSDTISRKAAIDAIREDADWLESQGSDWQTERKERDFQILAGLPSAQPSFSRDHAYDRSAEPCEDAVSRQAAIGALYDAMFDDDLKPTIVTAEQADTIMDAVRKLPSAQPERTCVNCGRTANNGGWYADGGTRCPIEEHYALPKDGYCHLWEKRNVTDDDYPERREE